MHSSLARRLAAPFGVLTGAGAAFAYVGAVDPNRPGHYPVCPLLRWTGLYCPACGGLRGTHALTHGDLTTALGANALAVAGYAAFAALWVAWVTAALRGREGLRLPLRATHWWAAATLVLAFTVVRNLPLGAALSPR
ncbi:DUF2752 domain-containing protein [Streptomyces sp. UNOC14_S4]|uniref:DUF2752 domain-containing protein n=1 Tax=Streptomyces sp. UNOC14_S4 TaxID=2872340 RepID=UPI001E362603|nr:DUF2752 domain-containing protein [Streptomyces sp. UNOC14_S4]MCC3769412.1 DUF2752 domain-containing protein [Streptomyces sp. UNOC14_S4]